VNNFIKILLRIQIQIAKIWRERNEENYLNIKSIWHAELKGFLHTYIFIYYKIYSSVPYPLYLSIYLSFSLSLILSVSLYLVSIHVSFYLSLYICISLYLKHIQKLQTLFPLGKDLILRNAMKLVMPHYMNDFWHWWTNQCTFLNERFFHLGVNFINILHALFCR